MINHERLQQSRFDAYISECGYERHRQEKEINLLFADFMGQVFPDRPYDNASTGEEPCLFHRDEMRRAYLFGYYAGERGDAVEVNLQSDSNPIEAKGEK